LAHPVQTVLTCVCIAGNYGVKKLLTDSQASTAAGSTTIEDDLGVTTIDRRQRWSHAKYPNSATLPVYMR